MRTILSTTLTAAVLLSGAGTATAERIMTWVDADGVRHFSQSPPAGPVRQLKTLELEPPAPAETDPARLDTIRAVAGELEAARLAREAARAPSRPATPPAPEAPPPERVIVVPTAPYGIAPPFHPRPPHPVPRDERDRDHRPPEDEDRPGRCPPAMVLPDV